MSFGTSEWLLLNANSAFFQLYHGENKLIFIEMMMRSALWIFYCWLTETSPQIDMSHHSGVKKSPSPTPGLVISTFGLAEIISCMPDGLVKIYISNIDKLVNIRVSTYIHICYMLFNQQQRFIYSTASFLSKLRAKVEKLHNSS